MTQQSLPLEWEPVKPCRRCGQVKPLSEFHCRKKARDGRRSVCAECIRPISAAKAIKRYYANQEHEQRRARNWYRAHREERKPKMREWQKAHASEFCRYMTQANRRRRPGKDAETLEFRAMLKQDPCAYCGTPPDGTNQVDHMVSSTDGGSNHWSNLTAACRNCNAMKFKRTPLFFLIERLQDSWRPT